MQARRVFEIMSSINLKVWPTGKKHWSIEPIQKLYLGFGLWHCIGSVHLINVIYSILSEGVAGVAGIQGQLISAAFTPDIHENASHFK